MRALFALLAVLLLGATAPAAKAPDWLHSATRTADGAWQIGNPRAPAQLTEYLSLTCPHCAEFTAESHAGLDAMVANGSLRIELRHAVRDSLDLSATLLARCAGAGKLRETMTTLFALQPQWEDAGIAYEQSHPTPALAPLADAAGLTQIMRGFGLERPRALACLANKPEQLTLARMADAAWKVMAAHSTPVRPVGTPSFAINGRFVGTTDWPGLETQLKQAGAR